MTPEEAEKKSEGDEILKPWLTARVNPESVRIAAGKCTVILSDNDPLNPIDDAKPGFQGNFPAEIVIETGRDISTRITT